MRLETTEAFERAFRALPEAKVDQVATALTKLESDFGKPHAHHGVRKLRGKLFEARAGIDLRILFRQEKARLFVLQLGTHDEIRRFLKKL